MNVEGDESKPLVEEGKAPEKTAKKRTWKKPKDKPKRPLSAYNIFFQHQRARIVEGFTGEPTPEDIVRSIEGILSKSREKRRHRKTHGRISFGDLARAIAEQWKTINPEHKKIFDHYAEVDMLRYRREVKVWRDKKEMESEANAVAKHNQFMSQMNSSFSSINSNDELNLDALPDDSIRSDSHASRGPYQESFNSSFSSVDSFSSQLALEPEPLQHVIQRQQAILKQQLRESNPNFSGSLTNASNVQASYGVPAAQAFHQSFGSVSNSMADFVPVQTLSQQSTHQMIPQHVQQQMLQQNHIIPMGNSSLSEIPNNSSHGPFADLRQLPPQTHSQNFQLGVGHSSFNASLTLGDALASQSNHVSDYSGSTSAHASFGVSNTGMSTSGHSRSSRMTDSDALMNPSSLHNRFQNSFNVSFALPQHPEESVVSRTDDYGGMDTDAANR